MATSFKPKKKIIEQISVAVCILFIGAYIIKETGRIWGFEKPAEQIAATFVAIGTPLQGVFLGKQWHKKDEGKK